MSNCLICNSTHSFPCHTPNYTSISHMCEPCYEKRECKDVKRIETHCNRCGKCDRVFERAIGSLKFWVCYVCEWKYENET